MIKIQNLILCNLKIYVRKKVVMTIDGNLYKNIGKLSNVLKYNKKGQDRNLYIFFYYYFFVR